MTVTYQRWNIISYVEIKKKKNTATNNNNNDQDDDEKNITKIVPNLNLNLIELINGNRS